jgi:hypothetical protein
VFARLVKSEKGQTGDPEMKKSTTGLCKRAMQEYKHMFTVMDLP